MTHKLVIEVDRQMRDVYTANFSQQILEQLAVQFIAEQQGFDPDAPNVRVQFETNVNADANPRRRVNMRVCVYVDSPMPEADEEGAGEAQAPSM